MKQILVRDSSCWSPIVFNILMSAPHEKIQLLQSTGGQELHADIVSQLFSSRIHDPSLRITVIVVRSIFISWGCHGDMTVHIESDNIR